MSEILFSGTGDRAFDASLQARARLYEGMTELSRRTDRSGRPLRRLAERVYTTNLTEEASSIFRRNAWRIIGALFPGCVISGRTAADARPVVDAETELAWVFLTGPYRRGVSLPGIEIRMNKGSGPLPGDIPISGLFLASPERHCLENLMASRTREGPSRTTGREAVERYLSEQCRIGGEDSLNGLRDRARAIASLLDAQSQFEEINGIVGALLHSREASGLVTREGKARAQGVPYDPKCVETLDALFAYLSSRPMPRRLDETRGAAAINGAFMEAYFSNFIEGTTFLVQEARELVFEGRISAQRPKDGRDVLATFTQLADLGRSNPSRDGADLVEELQARHARLMGHRPELLPGRFKTEWNRAGNTVFVAPDLVQGTLLRGHEMLSSITEPFARAVFLHFLVSAVHPFDDGNGRLARILMSKELAIGGLARVIVPTVYRDDYLGGQRALSRRSDAGANFRMLDRAQEVTAQIVENDLDACILMLASTMAFLEPGAHSRFQEPDGSIEIVWRDSVPAPADFWLAVDGAHSPFSLG